jgi:hypothetical protein
MSSDVSRPLGWVPFERALRVAWSAWNSSSVSSGGADQNGRAVSVTDSRSLVYPVAHECRGAEDLAQAACCPAESLEVASVAPPTRGTSL